MGRGDRRNSPKMKNLKNREKKKARQKKAREAAQAK